MNIFLLARSFLTALLNATAQVFTWINRREQQRENTQTTNRIEETMAAAAKPNPENAARLNAWLARGRSGRLRDNADES